MSGRPCIFLDRDGVLNVDLGYTYKIKDLKVVTGAVQGLRKLHNAGFCFVVVTNQSGVARGLYTLEDVAAFNEALVTKIKFDAPEIEFLDFMICPHHLEGTVSPYAIACECRKPGAKLVIDAALKHRLDLSKSWLIGDKTSDIDCAKNAGIRGIQVTKGGKQYGHHAAPFAKVDTLAEAADVILSTALV